MISPTSTPSATRVFVSTRARPKPTSGWGASATVRTIRSGTLLRTPPAYIKVPGRYSRSDKVQKSRGGPALADLARRVHDELSCLDDVDMAVRPDTDLVSLDERRRGRLELDLFALDSVRGQLPADAEKASRRLHADLLRLNRGDLRRALEVNLDFLGLQPAIDANGSAHPKFLGVDAALATQRAARGNLLRGNGAVHLKGAARLDLLGFQVPRDTRRSGRSEFLHVHVGIEDAGSGDPGGLRFQWTLDPRAPRGLELRRLDRVPGHDAAA